jgi:hypothetical protein
MQSPDLGLLGGQKVDLSTSHVPENMEIPEAFSTQLGSSPCTTYLTTSETDKVMDRIQLTRAEYAVIHRFKRDVVIARERVFSDNLPKEMI